MILAPSRCGFVAMEKMTAEAAGARATSTVALLPIRPKSLHFRIPSSKSIDLAPTAPVIGGTNWSILEARGGTNLLPPRPLQKITRSPESAISSPRRRREDLFLLQLTQHQSRDLRPD
ncbi:hypothetical protein TIFTF001_011205 [Ficus carica]|uniref:Uncharacterized protein n=1 Tax=Ficus carica TaxID=3494 RepID=A0AA88D407_FICCA|nr:hypothetical protein TIFTF001_011205 [Ficus carica]